MIDLVDVQAGKPKIQVPLTSVGLKGITYPVRVRRDGKEIDLLTRIDIFVDLPANRKGADFSRKIEAINEIILGNSVVPGVEELSGKIAEKVLEKLPYSTSCRVKISADYLREKQSDEKKRQIVIPYGLEGESVVSRSGTHYKMVGVNVTGMNACPCAMETTRALISRDFPGNDEFLSKIPSITHNQRNHVRIMIEVPPGRDVEADDLIEASEKVLGGSLHSLLKRLDEGELVYQAHLHPKFVEDIVREISQEILTRYVDFPDETRIIISSESEESIHPHNAFAEIDSTLGKIRSGTVKAD